MIAGENKKVLIVFGTRPEAIKMCPLVLELRKRESITTLVAVTGQHRQMLDQVLEAFDVTPDYDLSIMKDKQTLFEITASVLNGMKSVLEEVKPDLVLVHGDTSTTFVTALASFYLQIPVGHVEAGLRTYNIYSPYPEEFNREAVGAIASFNFAPTRISCENLLREGKRKDSIWITGNTAIDALQTTVREDYSHPELDWIGDNRLILITAHRRENLGEPMKHMFRAIKRVLDEHDDVKAIYPIHMNPVVRETANSVFGDDDRIRLIEPLDVLDFHNFMKKSYLILTDSGGIQEEAPALGKPVLVMRDTTERPEGITAGTLKLVGTNEDAIYKEFTKLLDDKEVYDAMAHAVNPYGDGHASERIADVIEKGNCEVFEAILTDKKDAELKNNQHYVFQAYLKAWTDDSNRLWEFKRGRSKIVYKGTKKTLSAFRTYELKDMNEDEIKFFDIVMDAFKLTEDNKKLVRDHLMMYLLPFANKKIVDFLKTYNPIPRSHQNSVELDVIFNKLDVSIEESIVNTEEDFFGDYEMDGIEWFRRISKGDLGFYYPDKNRRGDYDYVDRDEFLTFICIQYFRTLEMRSIMTDNINRMIKALERIKCSFDVRNVRVDHILPQYAFLLYNTVSTAFTSRNAHMTVIHNRTRLPFITSDQPVINLSYIKGENPKEFVVYYPISPDTAIVINDSSRVRTKEVDDKNVIDDYNRKIVEHFDNYLVGNSKDVLEGIAEMCL